MDGTYEGYGVVIPAFNAAKTIGGVIDGVKRHISGENILVVDDGSEDGTHGIAESKGVEVIKHDVNMGKGSALVTGFNYFLSRPEIAAVFTIDADAQHDPEEIPRFIEVFEAGEAEIVIGNRMNDVGDMPWIRKLTNRTTSAIISLRAGCRVEDSQSGYRLISTGVLRELELVTSRYDTESELLIKAGRMGARIASVSIKTIYADEVSSISPFRDTMRFLALVIRSFFW